VAAMAAARGRRSAIEKIIAVMGVALISFG
jgi:hypothetical protein